MKPSTFDRTLRAFVRRQPFRQFHVELVSGATLAVPHPKALAFNNGNAMLVAPDGELNIFDADEVSRVIYTPSATARRAKQV